MKTLLLFLLFVTSLYSQEYYYYENGKKVQLEKRITISRNNSSVDYYQNNAGILLGVSDKIILKLKLHDNLEKYLKLYDLNIIKKMSKNLYLVNVKDKSLTLEIANSLSQKEDVLYAQPDFIKKNLRR